MKLYILPILLFLSQLLKGQDGQRGAELVSSPDEISGTYYALIVGVSEYKDLDESRQLKYAHKDAEALFEFFVKHPDFKEENVELMINENASRIAFENKLLEFADKVQKGDNLFVYFAGHGDVPTKSGYGYILFHDAPVEERTYAFRGALSTIRLKEFLETQFTDREVRVVLILDACRSSKMDPETTQATLDALADPGWRIMKLLSCEADQLSHEFQDIGHGVFTYYLLEGLSGQAKDMNKNNLYESSEIEFYVNVRVGEKTNTLQKPVITGQGSIMSIADVAIDKKEASGGQEVAARGFSSTEWEAQPLVIGFRSLLDQSRTLRPVYLNIQEPPPAAGQSLIYDVHNDNTYSLAVTGDLAIAGSGDDKNIVVLNMNDGMGVKIEDKHGGFLSIDVSPDGRHIAAGSWSRIVKIYDLKTKELLKELPGHAHNIRALTYSPSGKLLVSGDNVGNFRVYDVDSDYKLIKDLKAHSVRIEDICFSADEKFFFTGSHDHKIKKWDATTFTNTGTYAGHTSKVNALEVFGPKTLLISGDDSGNVFVWDYSTDKKVSNHSLKRKDVRDLAITADGQYYFAVGSEHFAEVRRLDDGSLATTFTPSDRGLWQSALNLENNRLISTNHDGEVVVTEVVLPKPWASDLFKTRVNSSAVGRMAMKVLTGQYIIQLEKDAVDILNAFVNGEAILPSLNEVKEGIRKVELAQELLSGQNELFGRRLKSRQLALRGYGILLQSDPLQYDKAIQYFEEILQLDPYAGYPANAISLIRKEQNKIEEAKKSLLSAMDVIPQWTEPKSNMGRTYLLEGNYDKAKEEFQKIINLRPQIAKGYLGMAEIQLIYNNLKSAAEWIEKAEAAEPEHMKSFTLKAEIARRQGRYNDAIMEVNEGLKINPRADALLRIQGEVYLNIYKDHIRHEDYIIKAFESFNGAYQVDPDLVDNRLGLLKVFNQALTNDVNYPWTPEVDSLRQLASGLVEASPFSGAVRFEASITLVNTGTRPEDVIRSFSKLTDEVERAELLFYYGLFLNKIGKQNEALVAANSTIRLDPSYQKAYLLKSELLTSSGNEKEVETFYNDWQKKLPGDYSLFFNKAIWYMKSGNSNKARNAVSQGRAGDRNNAWLQTYSKLTGTNNSISMGSGDLQLAISEMNRISNDKLSFSYGGSTIVLDNELKFFARLNAGDELIGSLLLYRKGGFYGLKSLSGKTVLDAEFDEIKPLTGGYYQVKREAYRGAINDQGVQIIPTKYDELEGLTDELIKVSFRNVKGNIRFGAYNKSGVLKIPMDYTRIIVVKAKRGEQVLAMIGNTKHYYDLDGECKKCK